ncbi:hypothetical protein B0H11DRAFT_2228063 [Mycena galericulata]|nr:hypothetical protein B0H11DRAFT_2228063 [Mycena galericulata]
MRSRGACTPPRWASARPKRRALQAMRSGGRGCGTGRTSPTGRNSPASTAHARFGEGFALGWDDAYIFFTSSHAGGGGGGNVAVSELGFVGAWAKTRTDDHGSSFWEFLHGFKQGAAAARKRFPGKLLRGVMS